MKTNTTLTTLDLRSVKHSPEAAQVFEELIRCDIGTGNCAGLNNKTKPKYGTHHNIKQATGSAMRWKVYRVMF